MIRGLCILDEEAPDDRRSAADAFDYVRDLENHWRSGTRHGGRGRGADRGL
jgi:hypothetical protein